MALPTALIAKGLAGVGIVAAGTTGIVLVLNRDPNKAINEKIKKLGIEDTTCHFTGNKTSVSCTLDKAKLEKVKFDGKNGNTVTENANVSLKIEKLTEENIPSGLVFTFTNSATSNVEIGDNGNKITFKSNISTDYKIKEDGENLKLEKAWTLESLGKKVGLTCTNSNTNECTLPTTEGINVWKNNDDYITKATQAEANKKMTVASETAHYHEGFKFTVSEDINLTVSGGNSGGINKLTKTSTNSTSYEIALKDLGGDKGKKWFLVEKSSTTAG